MLSLILILTGLIGLWFGTKWIVNGAIGIAKKFDLSHSFVGLAILAVGTDLPEIFVSIKASLLHLKGIESSGIITGNAIGSSLSQITIILGIAGLFTNFTIGPKDLLRDGIALFASVLFLYVFGFDGSIGRIEGGILLSIYLVYYFSLMRGHSNLNDDNSQGDNLANSKIALLLTCGFVVLIFSSHVVVVNAISLAEKWGVAQSFVGIAIIGLGTSLPELAVSVGAAMRKSVGMSIGNIIGSNIFDGLIPIGLGAVISPLKFDNVLLVYDLPLLFAFTLLVILFLKTKNGISQPASILLILFYLAYIFTKYRYF